MPRAAARRSQVVPQSKQLGSKVRENNKKQNRAEVENSFLKQKQRAGSKVDGKKQRQKIYLEEIPVLTGELFLLVACV